MTKAVDDKRVSEWAPPTEILNSCYGRVTYEQWCNYEVRRLNRMEPNGTAHVVDDRQGYRKVIAVSR